MNKYYIITRHFVILCSEAAYKGRQYDNTDSLLTVLGDVYKLPSDDNIGLVGPLVKETVIVKYDPSSLVIVVP